MEFDRRRAYEPKETVGQKLFGGLILFITGFAFALAVTILMEMK